MKAGRFHILSSIIARSGTEYQNQYYKMIEIGVAKGTLSKTLLDTHPNLEIIGIDPYKTYEDYAPRNKAYLNQAKQDIHYRSALKKMGGNPRFTLMKEDSRVAMKKIPAGSIDIVFIDGNHSYKYVRQDIENSWRVVRPEGTIAGHDWCLDDVKRAVFEFIEKHKVDLVAGKGQLADYCWYFKK